MAWLLLLALITACASQPIAEPESDAVAGSAWAAWPMPNSEGLGLPNEQSYEVLAFDEQEIVHDRVTGLDWQQKIDAASFAFDAAREHCEALEYAGYGDWRLPTRIELVSLLDLSRTNPALALAAFPSAPGEWYWTASADRADPSRGWYVYFYFGYPDVDDRAVENRVRCVRSVGLLAPAPNHYEIQRDWVRDFSTGLLWQRAPSEQSFSFAQATEYCARLVVGEESEFRVPTMKELQTLVDERHQGPAIDVAAFPNTPNERFWSSSAWSGSANLAWYVRFDSGSALYDLASEPLRVRCVH